MFVFKPSEPRPLYIQKNVSREEVQWGVFVPRDVPGSFTSEAYQWLNRSQFYFLTKSQVIDFLQKCEQVIDAILENLYLCRTLSLNVLFPKRAGQIYSSAMDVVVLALYPTTVRLCVTSVT